MRVRIPLAAPYRMSIVNFGHIGLAYVFGSFLISCGIGAQNTASHGVVAFGSFIVLAAAVVAIAKAIDSA